MFSVLSVKLLSQEIDLRIPAKEEGGYYFDSDSEKKMDNLNSQGWFERKKVSAC